MIPVLYEKGTTSFRTLGLGFLPSWIQGTPEVHEERNGEFFFQGELPVGGLHVDQLAEERIILCAPAPGKDMQPFQISKIYKPPESDTVQVLAKHVSYQLTEHACKPNNFRFASAQQAMDWLFGGGGMVPQIDTTLWSFESDITLAEPVNMRHDEPLSVRAILGGAEDSLVDLYGGELEWDGWTVRLLQQRGQARSKPIRYGVNMGGVSYEIDTTGLVTCYFGWWRDSDGNFPTYARIDMPNIADFAYPRVEIVDLSGKIELAEGQVTPTDAQMQEALQAYANEQHDNYLRMRIKITAVPEELQDVFLCDTVPVVHPVYDLLQTAKIVKTVFDPIEERYKEITIGELELTITDTIAGLLRGGTK